MWEKVISRRNVYVLALIRGNCIQTNAGDPNFFQTEVRERVLLRGLPDRYLLSCLQQIRRELGLFDLISLLNGVISLRNV